jgi:long-chain acyl-CoA synthetase
VTAVAGVQPVAHRFRRHAKARIVGPDGCEALPLLADDRVVIADLPYAVAVSRALARGALGLPFRIGAGTLPAPEAGSRPVFETLTSGSTGVPRRIRRSQRSWCESFAVNARLFGIGPGRRLAVLGRMEHSLALYGALEGACLGAEVHLLAGLRPDAQHRALAERRVQVVYATPAQLRLLVETGPGPLPDLQLVLVGGSKLDQTLRSGLEAFSPALEVREFYGAAETSFVTLSDAGSAPEGVGRVFPGVRLEIRGVDGKVLGPGGLGEVWVRSPYLCERYGDPCGMPKLKRQGWMSVGEMGWMERGELHLAGRAGRMVTVADQNVFPEEIEAFLMGLPGVQRAIVLPRADRLRGHVIVAVLQGDPTEEAAILQAARARLGPLKMPRAVIWREVWPETASGKVDLTRLAAEVGL